MIIRKENESDIANVTTVHNQAFNGPDEVEIIRREGKDEKNFLGVFRFYLLVQLRFGKRK